MAAQPIGNFDNLVNAVNQRSEKRDNNSAGRLLEKFLKIFFNHPFRQRIAGLFGISAFQKKSVNFLLADFFQLGDSLGLVFFVVIKFKVADINHFANGRIQDETESVRNIMSHAKKFRFKIFRKFNFIFILNQLEVELGGFRKFSLSFIDDFLG